MKRPGCNRLDASFRVAVALASVLAPSAGAQTVSPCRPFDDAAQATLDWARLTVSGSDSSQVESRAHLRIPKVAANKVTYVTDPKLCQKAVTAYAAAANVSVTARSVYLFKVGSIYVIKDPTVYAGEWVYSMTADSKFRNLVKFTG